MLFLDGDPRPDVVIHCVPDSCGRKLAEFVWVGERIVFRQHGGFPQEDDSFIREEDLHWAYLDGGEANWVEAGAIQISCTDSAHEKHRLELLPLDDVLRELELSKATRKMRRLYR